MNEIRIKLRSEKGASISFALLLFLVCAVAGSVILVAATAASGRLSRLAESDQRYYSVTSAAELVKNRFDDQSVSVVATRTSVSTKTYDYSGKETGSSSDSDTTAFSINGDPVGFGFQPDSILADAAYKMTIPEAGASFPASDSFLLSASDGTGTSYPALNVRIEETLAEDGTITLILKNDTGRSGTGTGTSAKNEYSLRMTLQVDRKENTDTRTETGTPQQVDTDSYQITTTQTQVTTTVLTWKLTGIETVTGGS